MNRVHWHFSILMVFCLAHMVSAQETVLPPADEAVESAFFSPAEPGELFAPGGLQRDEHAEIIIPDPESRVSQDAPDIDLATGCTDCGEAVSLSAEGDDDEDDPAPVDFLAALEQPYSAYRMEEKSIAWLTGSGADFGWVDWTTAPYLARGQQLA